MPVQVPLEDVSVDPVQITRTTITHQVQKHMKITNGRWLTSYFKQIVKKKIRYMESKVLKGSYLNEEDSQLFGVVPATDLEEN